MTEANKHGLLWIETCLNAIISNCQDKDIKDNLLKSKKALIRAIDCAFKN